MSKAYSRHQDTLLAMRDKAAQTLFVPSAFNGGMLEEKKCSNRPTAEGQMQADR